MNNVDDEAPGQGGQGGEGEGGSAAEPESQPSRPTFRPAHLILIAGLIAVIVIFAIKPAPAPVEIVKKQMPKFSLVNIAGGNMKSEDLRGKVLVVDFWAEWCGPCKREIPQYNKVVASMTGKDFEMIGYAVESGGLDDVREAAKKLGIQYPVVMGTDEVTSAFGNYRGLPTTFVIGKDGKIYKKYEGTFDNKVAQVAKDVEELLTAPYSESTAQLVR